MAFLKNPISEDLFFFCTDHLLKIIRFEAMDGDLLEILYLSSLDIFLYLFSLSVWTLKIN